MRCFTLVVLLCPGISKSHSQVGWSGQYANNVAVLLQRNQLFDNY